MTELRSETTGKLAGKYQCADDGEVVIETKEKDQYYRFHIKGTTVFLEELPKTMKSK